MSESKGIQENPTLNEIKDGEFNVSWELVSPGSKRWKDLVANTITDDLLQAATTAAGYTEMANDSSFADRRDIFLPEADKAARETADRLQLLRDLLTSNHNQIPTVRKYDDPNKDLISLNAYKQLKDSSKQHSQAKPTK